MAKEERGSRTFGAFTGVFVPTFLSIVGVILFLRLGYIVGGAGLLGSVAIIVIAVSVTISTGLSLSSIASNIRIGAGGAYSIINKTLGLEIGGSVGIPLYLAQTFSVALYLFGFAEAWQYIFPGHSLVLIVLASFLLLFFLTYISTSIAVKVQMGVFILICIALIMVFAGGIRGDIVTPTKTVAGTPNFWVLFAIFFPAVTGLMAGIGMSGELSDPKKQIPKGVLYGLGVTAVIYIATAVLLAVSATQQELLTNTLIIVDIALISEFVVIGILAATFSSALTVIIAAPRVLEALGENQVLPKSKFFSQRSPKGEPRNAVIVTGLIIVPLILVGSLDSVAKVLTMLFLVTYVMINISVFLEQHLGLRSFRPTFKVPKLVPLYGTVGSITLMFLINPYASVIAILIIISVYSLLAKKTLEQKTGDVRSGLFRSISQWAAEKTRTLPESSMHIWKPNMIVPVQSTKTLRGNFPLIESIAYPNGSMTVLGFKPKDGPGDTPEENLTKQERAKELKMLPKLVDKFSENKIYTSYSTVEFDNYVNALTVSMSAIGSQVFAPNMVLLPYKPTELHPNDLKSIVKTSKEEKCGIVLFDKDEEIG
ncbi:MAG: amino acid permease, partial [archaeon]